MSAKWNRGPFDFGQPFSFEHGDASPRELLRRDPTGWRRMHLFNPRTGEIESLGWERKEQAEGHDPGDEDRR